MIVRPLSVLIAGLMACAGLAGCASATRASASADPTAAHVPWNAPSLQPVSDSSTPARQAGAPAGMRGCRNADLRVESARTAPATGDDGWLSTSFVLRSVSATACSIAHGVIDVQLVSAAAEALPIDALPSGPAAFPGSLAVQPGQLVTGVARWAVTVGKTPTPTRLVIDPDGTGTVGAADLGADPLVVSLAGVTIPPHPRDPSNQGPWRATSYGDIEQVVDAGTRTSLAVAVSAPSTVALGAVLKYSVTLTNPTATAVPLSPCPDFTETLRIVPLKFASTVAYRGLLNCAQAPPRSRRAARCGWPIDSTPAARSPAQARSPGNSPAAQPPPPASRSTDPTGRLSTDMVS